MMGLFSSSVLFHIQQILFYVHSGIILYDMTFQYLIIL